MNKIRKFILVNMIVFLVLTLTACDTQVSTELGKANAKVTNYSSVIVEHQYSYNKKGTFNPNINYAILRAQKGNVKANYGNNENQTYYYNNGDNNYRLKKMDSTKIYEELSVDVVKLWNFRSLVPRLEHTNTEYTVDGFYHIYNIIMNGETLVEHYPMLDNMIKMPTHLHESNPGVSLKDINIEIKLKLDPVENTFVEMDVSSGPYLDTIFKSDLDDLVNSKSKFIFTYLDPSAPIITLGDYQKDDAPSGYDGLIPTMQIGEWFTVNVDYTYDSEYVKFITPTGDFLKLEFQGTDYMWNIYLIDNFDHIGFLEAQAMFLPKGEYMIHIRGLNIGQITFRLSKLT